MITRVDLIGFPSGQVITIYSAFIQFLYSYGFILKHPDYGWTFKDEDEHRIRKIVESNICLFFNI
jgi:hypothetical protein